eukprot:3796881-Rhodomonas_salina.2
MAAGAVLDHSINTDTALELSSAACSAFALNTSRTSTCLMLACALGAATLSTAQPSTRRQPLSVEPHAPLT